MITEEQKIVMNIPKGDYDFSPEIAVGLLKIVVDTALFMRTAINELGVEDDKHVAAFRTILVEMIRADEYAQKMTKE